jgi:hypothetical protein
VRGNCERSLRTTYRSTYLCTTPPSTLLSFPILQKVVSVLLTRGRMPVVQLARYAHLRPRTARACVLVLVQHNICWHAQTQEDGEVLEINPDEILLRLRYGRYVWQAEQLFGTTVSETLVSRIERKSTHTMIGCRNPATCTRPWKATAPGNYYQGFVLQSQRCVPLLSHLKQYV